MPDVPPLSRRTLLAATAAAGLAAPAAATASGITGTVPSGRTRVWQIGAQRDFDTLELVERPIPVPGPGEALVRVHYAAIAARDQGIVRAMFPVPPGPRPATRIPLSEGSGEVLAVGPGEVRIRPGDRVTACHWGAWVSGPWTPDYYAADIGNTVDGWLGEHVLLPTASLAKLPDAMAWEDAATLAGSGVTAWHALHEVARVRSDDTVLTLGTGGVSSFGLLLAKAAGARVVVTSSSDEKLEEMRRLGADVTVNYRANPQWGREVAEKTGGGATVVLENVGPGTLDQSMAASAVNARIVMIGTGRPPPNPPNLYGLYMKNLSLKAISAGSRQMLEGLLTALAQNRIRPVIAKTIPFADAVQAWREIQGGEQLGKIVVRVA